MQPQSTAPPSSLRATLTVIGTGPVAMTLGRLFAVRGVFRVAQVLGRSRRSASDAVRFIDPHALAHEDARALVRSEGEQIVLIATPDRAIAETAASLAELPFLAQGDGVLHVSGALDATPLAPCRARGAWVASVHPLVSFADPHGLVQEFNGVPCAIEGDAAALPLLQAAFAAIGGRCVTLVPGTKPLYHAGAVLASNYVASVLQAALAAQALAGIAPEEALGLLAPLVKSGVANVLTRGPRRALTGPLVRGDDEVVRAHAAALEAADPALAQCYAALTAWTAHWLERPNPLERES